MAGITFLNDYEFLVATNDSSVRLFTIQECSQAVKFKGHLNDNLQMIPSCEKDTEMIACGGEDGRIIFWNLANIRIINQIEKKV